MKKQIKLVILLFTVICLSTYAQKSYQGNESLKWYTKGVLAFENQNFSLAKVYFDKTRKSHKSSKNIEIYQLMSSISLNEANAGDQVKQYLEVHPFTPHRTVLILTLANYYFKKKHTKTALKWFDKLDVKYLTTEEEINYNYKLAFANYSAANYTKAKQYLLPITQSGAYQDEANYYLANIAIQTKDYNTALSYLEKINGVSKYKREIDYQTLVILYQQKEYQKTIKLGENNFERAIGFEKSEMAKIIGESYFHVGEYEKAITYLLLYKGRKNKLTGTDYYFLGYSFYKRESYKEAIQNFNKITDEKSTVAQNAHYHLADCYLKLNQKTEALNAFKNASEMTFDVDIQKDAYLNYAKLSYEIGNPYVSSSEVLQNFVNLYPNASEANEIKGLIINAYLQYQDYDGALTYYKNQKILKDSQYQLVLLEKGLTLFSTYKYQEALPYFTEASNMFLNDEIKNKALFWKAETLSELNNFKGAAYYYKSFLNDGKNRQIKEYNDGLYGVAYSLFQQKKYAEAIIYFENYVSKIENGDKKINAILRIGDCNYVTKDYWKALDNYNKVIEHNGAQVDYAMYQKGLAYGFLGRNKQKIKALKNLQTSFKTSAYLDNSYYQLGNLYVNQNKTDLALEAYNYLTNNYPKSPLVAKTMLKQGSVYFNSENNSEAVKILRNIVSSYPGTTEAVQAVKIAEQVYKDMDKVEVYAAWVKKLEFINISDVDIDRTMFEAVENRYLDNQLKETITSGKKYLINFPNGVYALTTNFYVAQAFFNTNEKEKAIPYYQQVIDKNTNEFTEISMNRLSQIYLENQNWTLASPLLLQLESESNNDQNVVYAQSNLMKYYFTIKEYRKAILYTDKVLENKKSTEQAVEDAYIFGARSAVAIKQMDKAKLYYQKLETLGKGVVLAEANYYKALWLYKDKDYEKSNKQIQVLASKYQGYKYWGVKGLVLMAQNFHELKDNFQASFILKNVITNAQEFKDVVESAQTLLNEYQPGKKEESSGEKLSKDVENEL